MEMKIAACGLDCNVCPAHVASVTNDNELRRKTAAEWSKAHGFAFTPEMINCHGCHAKDGVQIGHCAMCEIRACVLSKSFTSCAPCENLGNCDKTKEFYVHCPHALTNLQALGSR